MNDTELRQMWDSLGLSEEGRATQKAAVEEARLARIASLPIPLEDRQRMVKSQLAIGSLDRRKSRGRRGNDHASLCLQYLDPMSRNVIVGIFNWSISHLRERGEGTMT
jgi:hypothetical protein